MKPSRYASQHVAAHFADGYFGVDAPREQVVLAYREYVHDFLGRLGHVFPPDTPRPLLEVASLAMAKCCAEHVVSEAQQLPAGPVVLSFSHNLPFVDAAGIVVHLARAYPYRRFALVASMRTLSRVIPGWARHNDGQFSIVEVAWQSDEAGQPIATNGAEVVDAAIQHLQGGPDRVLLIAPDGRQSLLRNGVLREPFRGFDLVARDADAKVVPVVTRGVPKSRPEVCDFAQIHTCFLPALEVRPNQSPSELWSHVVVASTDGSGRQFSSASGLDQRPPSNRS